jgi:hypothetical protein
VIAILLRGYHVSSPCSDYPDGDKKISDMENTLLWTYQINSENKARVVFLA